MTKHTAKSLQQAFHYLFPDEVTALQDLARMLPPEPVVVNIGAGAGTSGLALMESRDDLHLCTIDIQKEASPLGCLVAEEKVLKEAGLWGVRTVQVTADSKEVGRYWQTTDKQPLVDLVFVDGDHSYEGCSGDIMAWLPNIKPGGILAIHDYDKAGRMAREGWPEDAPHPKPWPGVDQAVNELIKAGYKIVLHVDTLIAFKVGERNQTTPSNWSRSEVKR